MTKKLGNKGMCQRLAYGQPRKHIKPEVSFSKCLWKWRTLLGQICCQLQQNKIFATLFHFHKSLFLLLNVWHDPFLRLVQSNGHQYYSTHEFYCTPLLEEENEQEPKCKSFYTIILLILKRFRSMTHFRKTNFYMEVQKVHTLLFKEAHCTSLLFIDITPCSHFWSAC